MKRRRARRLPLDVDALATANRVLAWLAPDEAARLEVRRGRLWVVTRWGARGASVRANGVHPAFVPGPIGLGGTQAAAIVQLVRWVRRQPRRPVSFWWAWLAPVGAATVPEAMGVLQLLLDSTYNDPQATACVRCGAPEPRDWWAVEPAVGPCCLSRCAQPIPAAIALRDPVRAARKQTLTL